MLFDDVCSYRSQNHRMVEVGRDLWRSSGPTPCSSRDSQSWLPSTMSRWLLSISKGGDSTASLGKLCWGSVTHAVNKCFLVFRGNHLCFSLCSLPLVLHWGPLERVCLHPLCTLPLGIDTHWWGPPWTFSSPGWAVPALSAFPHRTDAPVPSSSLWPFDGLSLVCPCLSCTGEPRTGPSAPGVASPLLSTGEGSPPLTNKVNSLTAYRSSHSSLTSLEKNSYVFVALFTYTNIYLFIYLFLELWRREKNEISHTCGLFPLLKYVRMHKQV